MVLNSWLRATKQAMPLDVISHPLEQSYRVGDAHRTKLFLALCRSRGLLPYRHRRSHAGTISVRASIAEHDALGLAISSWIASCRSSRPS
jgi:hypothetical protein